MTHWTGQSGRYKLKSIPATTCIGLLVKKRKAGSTKPSQMSEIVAPSNGYDIVFVIG